MFNTNVHLYSPFVTQSFHLTNQPDELVEIDDGEKVEDDGSQKKSGLMVHK